MAAPIGAAFAQMGRASRNRGPAGHDRLPVRHSGRNTCHLDADDSLETMASTWPFDKKRKGCRIVAPPGRK
ncbi:MAG: hypothetical protein V2A73_16610 [Pseudomonadota bacterium]